MINQIYKQSNEIKNIRSKELTAINFFLFTSDVMFFTKNILLRVFGKIKRGVLVLRNIQIFEISECLGYYVQNSL